MTIKQHEELDLKQFWEIEDLNPKRKITPEEEVCEKLFMNSLTRETDGRFIASIPFKEGKNGPEKLGSSKSLCLARFKQLEKRLERDNDLRIEYNQVMKEYLDLGHMKLVTNQPEYTKKYYIPHHPVIKPDSLTTKTRVVFDASANTTNGKSLNETMYVGGKQQKDLMDILIKWRKNRIVFKADISKMYRQIKLTEGDQQYHTILWRNSPNEQLQEYQLTTVTFGTTSAPYMATRVLKCVAEESQAKYPIASEIIKNDFYVDDLISGCDNIEQALIAKEELIASLQEGKFCLRKWTSNSKMLLDSLPEELTEKSLQNFNEEFSTKALGLQWNPITDQFNFDVKWLPEKGPLTKRRLLSEASKLFDPLGWLAPVVLNAKLFMQEIWLSKINWDDELPENIKIKWIQFREELPMLKLIMIDRWIEYTSISKIQIIGFCDASEKAYAAVVYTRVESNNEVKITMITSKTRVAPIKMKTTLPKLELCSAVLLANLLTRTKEALEMDQAIIYAWSDSTASLGWLKGEPNRWKTFVANRVSEVQSNNIHEWNYVSSEENPADCATRGLMPHELQKHELWWHGPKWLKNHPASWARTTINIPELEQKRVVVNAVTITDSDWVPGASSWPKLVRIIAYCLRMKSKNHAATFTLKELNDAKTILYRVCQQDAFAEEISSLKENKPVSKKSKLVSLNPFLDDKNVLRVGGRLQNTISTYDNKHPVILPQNHRISQLIIKQMHKDTIHGGPQLMVNLLRKRYWILQCKRSATEIYKKCVMCRKNKGKTYQPMMGQLPKERVTLERAFLITGVDYAGPVEIKASKLRNAKILKGYIAIFVCFGTKAFHIELVSDQTSEAFLAAFNRFIARRGLCKKMYSDNGTNFVGGSNKLKKAEQQFLHQKNTELAEQAINQGIEWEFIPPASPNFGGIWEKGVKSTKEHLYKQFQTARLTFEEYNTVLCQIEACLNSRPLCPLTSDNENLNALTPGHFLIGDALLAPAEVMLADNTYNKTNRWRHLQLLQQHFWTRWSREYLNQLQQRHKWQQQGVNPQINELVAIKDEQLPPRMWALGRIIATHPGKDGIVRVATVKTATTELKRPVTKLCSLMEPKKEENIIPIDNEESRKAVKKTNSKAEEIDNETSPEVLDSSTSNNVSNSKGGQAAVPAKDQNSSTRVLRPRKINKLGSAITTLICLLVLGGSSALPISKDNPLRINQFTHASGVYFEDMGKVNVIKTEWHLYNRFSMSQYMHEYNILNEMTQNLEKACKQFTLQRYQEQCSNIARVLSGNVEEIKKLNTLLKSTGGETNRNDTRRRTRAAPLNAIGWIGHELFGLMAADQADNIEKQFELVDQNENHLINLVKNQTSIIDTTVNLMKTTEDEINKSYGNMTNLMHNITKEIGNIKRMKQVQEVALYLSLLVNRFEKVQRNILEIVTDVHEGHINSNVFTPQQFQEQLTFINNNLPSGNKIPGNQPHDMRILYKIITAKARVTTKNIILDIVLPLVSTIDYQLLQIIPVPVQHQDQQLCIIPQSKYLLITLQRDKFYQLEEKDIHNCIKPKDNLFVCKIQSPLYNGQSEKSRCERDLLMQAADISPRCHFNVTKQEEFWHPLKRKNHWIFFLIKPITIQIICDDTSHTQMMQGSGVLEINPGCELIHPTMSIITETNKTSEGQLNIYPRLNLNESITQAENYEELKIYNFTIDHTQQMKNIHQRINELNQHSRLSKIHQATHLGFTTLAFTILIALSVGIFIKRNQIIKSMHDYYMTRESGGNAKSDDQNRPDNRQNDDQPVVRIPEARSSTVGRYEGEDVQSHKKIYKPISK